MTVEQTEVDPFDAPARAAGHRAARRVQRAPASCRRPTCTSRGGSAGCRRRVRRGGAAGRGSGRARDAARVGVLDLAEVTRDRRRRRRGVGGRRRRAALARGRPWQDAVAASPLVAHGAAATRSGRCGWSTACSTSTATGGRRSWSRSELDERSARPAPDGRPTVLARAGARPAVHRRARRRPAAGGRGRALRPVTRARRRAGHRQDHDGRPAARPAAQQHAGLAADRAGRAHRQGGRAAGGGGRARGRPRRPPTVARSASCSLDAAPAARLAAGQPQPVPPRPDQPAAVRRRRRRRELDGVADDDGPAARGAAARRPGWCWSATPTSSRRSRPARCSATWSAPAVATALDHERGAADRAVPLRRRRSASWPTRCATTGPTG